MKEKNYGILNFNFIDNIIKKKRSEMQNILNKNIKDNDIESFLDIGTTEENELESSNYFVKNYEKIKIKNSISDQEIKNVNFNKFLKKSITSDFSKTEIENYKSDLVISSATIEHVGRYENQMKMLENIINLTKKYFFITTPNRFFPIDFHTKLPIIHMLPKKIHRKILRLINLDEYAEEENLNLLDENTVNKLINTQQNASFKIRIFKVKLFGLTSNLLIFGEKKNNDLFNNSTSF